MSANKTIKSEQWYIKDLESKVSNGEIQKPKYQRRKKWDEHPKNDALKKKKLPSEKRYIEFLIKTRNSVHALTFGQNGSIFTNIDGNNRINAIMHYLNKPFELFPEYLIDLSHNLTKTINLKVSKQVIDILKITKYDDIMSFKYNKFFIDIGYSELYNEHLKKFRDEMENHFEELANKLKIDGKDRFDKDVIINVNLFNGYSTEELAEVFGEINKYGATLTEQEALASGLFNITDFSIKDERIEREIKHHVKLYYSNKADKEALECYKYNENEDPINAYDFIVGFQNYSSEKCSLIQKVDAVGLSLFFKIFKAVYKSAFEKTITTDNINDFIGLMDRSIVVLQRIHERLFMENNKTVEIENPIKHLGSSKKNLWFLVISSIIGFIRKGVSNDTIIKHIEKSLIYHVMILCLSDKDIKDKYRLNDGYAYEAGGYFIDARAKDYVKNPYLVDNKISREVFDQVLKQLFVENIKNVEFGNGPDKRKKRKLHERILINYYYHYKVPREYLADVFWIEHIFPFSSDWTNQIDIDRLGNVFPILDTLNKDRGNNHIREYRKNDRQTFLKFIDVIPSDETYDEIITHNKKKPHIMKTDKYNEFCENNENKLSECFLDYIFRTE